MSGIWKSLDICCKEETDLFEEYSFLLVVFWFEALMIEKYAYFIETIK